MRHSALALIAVLAVILICGCHQEHKTITAKLVVVAEYDPDTQAHYSEARSRLPLDQVLGKNERYLIDHRWKPLYKVPGKYTPNRPEYQLWFAPDGRCYKTLDNRNGMIWLIEGPYTPPT